MKSYCPQCQKTYEGVNFELCPEDGARLFQLDAPKSEDPLIGAIVDERFRIEELLGAGGMGAVYRGVQLSVNREVAIKVLRPELAGREQALERFFREAKVVSELTHPNIVRLIEFGQDRERDLLYLVMELIRGADMGELLRRGRLRINLALEVVYQICGALTESHARGIVHRDLKPENLVLLPISDGTLQVKVLDFGIARTLERGTQLTKTGMICGTPSYMAPEQAQNLTLDGRTDLYALGIILFEMLSGRPPFVGETSLQILLQHIQAPAPNLTAAMPAGSVPEAVGELVEQLLEKDPEQRPASARAVRDRIDELRMDLRLRPVRLDQDGGDDDVFEAWLLPRIMKLRGGEADSERVEDSSLDLGLSLDGLGDEDTIDARGLTSAETLVTGRRKTQQEFANADTMLVQPEARVAGDEPASRDGSAVEERGLSQPHVLSVRSASGQRTEDYTDRIGAARIAKTDKRRVIGASLVVVAILIGAGLQLASVVKGKQEVEVPRATVEVEAPQEVPDATVEEAIKEPIEEALLEEEPAAALAQEQLEVGEEDEAEEELAAGVATSKEEKAEEAVPVAVQPSSKRSVREDVRRDVKKEPSPPPREEPAAAPPAEPTEPAPKPAAEVARPVGSGESQDKAGALDRARQLREQRQPGSQAPTNQELHERLRSLRGE